MSTTLTAPPKSNTKLQYLQKRFNDTVMLVAEKVAAHLLSPQSYPMPGGKNLERALYDVAMALPKRKRENFADKFKASVNASDAQRKQKYGDLHAVNLRANKAIADQVKALPVEDKMKFTETDVKTFFSKYSFVNPKKSGGKILGKTRAKVQPQQASVDATQLQFIVDSLTCIKTNDIRKDEISLGGFAVDNFGVENDKAPFSVGEFKKTDTVGLGANAALFSFSIDGGSTGIVFPATFVAGIFLVEADLIHNAELGAKLAFLFSLMGSVMIAVSIGLVFVPGGIPFAIAGLFIAGGFSLLGHYIIPVMIDDFSFAITDTLTLEGPLAVGDTFNRSLATEINSTIFNVVKGSYTAAARWVAS